MQKLVIIVVTLFVFLGLASCAQADDLNYKDSASLQYKKALAARKVVKRGTEALGRPSPLLVPKYAVFALDYDPSQGTVYQLWGEKCRNMRLYWQKVKIPGLEYRLSNPRGSGAKRWWPLAWYVGWPVAERRNWVYCVTHESHGNPTTVGEAGERGIMQIHPIHARKFKQITGVSFWRQDTEDNVRFGLWLWEQGEEAYGNGWRPWSVFR